MPYIAQTDRKRIDIIKQADIRTAGDLNYAITTLIKKYMDESVGRYQQANDVMGALEGAKLEFYRRHLAAYEDEAIIKNGDVY